MEARARAFLGLGILLIVALAMVGCAGGGVASLPGQSSSGMQPAIVIGTDYFGKTVASFTVNPTTGTLTEAKSSPVPSALVCPWAVAVTPNGRFAYTGDQCFPNLEIFAVDPATGELSSKGTVPLSAGGVTSVSSIAITPDGKYLYVPDRTRLNGFSINASTGALTVLPGFPMTAGKLPISAAVDPRGRFLYVIDDTGNAIHEFSIDSPTGALSAIAGSPVPCFGTFDCQGGMAIDGAGRFVYLAQTFELSVKGWEVGADGGLTSTGASVPTTTSPFEALADPTGKYVYSINGSIGYYNSYTIDATTGALTPIAASNPFVASGTPCGAAIDPSGRFLYASDRDHNLITGYSIGTGGVLSPILGLPMAVHNNSFCAGIAVTRR